jgi:ferredoxin-nitrate reductase
VVDPRRTASCASADLHLPIKPGTDVTLFNGIARELWRSGNIDLKFISEHTEGWDALQATLAHYTLEHTAHVCGVPAEDIALAAKWLGGNRRFLSMWTMGLNQSAVGVDKNIALIQLSLITGKIGKPGCGPFSLTGQPNAMGGREVGGMATLLPAHRDMSNPSHRQQVADFWGVPSVPEKPGLTAVEMFDALRSGKMKAIWIIATNPIASLPNAWKAEEALRNAELVVAQDIYPTETTDLADVILPAAAWLEKCGTMTNSDRRISLLEKAVEPPGEARADADILLHFARQMGWGPQFAYPGVAEVFGEHAALTAGTDVDISGLSHARLRQDGSMQWPCPSAESHGTPRLYTNHKFPTASGKAALYGVEYVHQSEAITEELPLVLTTGRVRDQWHTMTKTGTVGKLRQHIDAPFCEIHPADARRRDVGSGDIVVVRGDRGHVQVKAVITADIRPGVVFLPMHWGKKLGGERGRSNNVTSAILDPVSKEPDLKFAAVEVAKHVPAKRRIVIIGAGTAALAFIEAHRRVNSVDEIHLFGAEPGPIYNRVLLPHYIDGTRSWQSMVRADTAALRERNVHFHRATGVAKIDREHSLVVDEHGVSHGYDVLILATGSRAAVWYDGLLPASGIYTLRGRRDADEILAAAATAKRIVINGGGLLGLELADALSRIGHQVTILQRSGRLMGKQLDESAAALLAEEVKDRGIEILFNEQVAYLGNAAAMEKIHLQSGKELPCDMFIFATGVTPNKELGGAARLDCGKGVIVNKYMQTSCERIFAIGEVAEFEEQTYGTTPAAEAQARALVEYLRGNLHSPYRGSVTANILKIHGLSLASAGVVDTTEHPEAQCVTLADPQHRFYQKCVVENDRLIGTILMGDTSRFAEFLEWIESGLELEERRASLLRPGGAEARLDGALVCSCNHVGAGTITKAIAACGADLAAVCSSSRAGSSCGSCRPEVQRLIQLHAQTTASVAAGYA